MPTDSITKNFVVKDYDAYLKLLQEIENKEMTDCNDCPHISITEEVQDYLKKAVGKSALYPHICMKYNQRVYHLGNEPRLYPCQECEEEKENEL